MPDVLERLALLSGSRGPRNSRRGNSQFVVEDMLVALGWIHKAHVVELLLVKYGGMPPEEMEHVPSALELRWRHEIGKYRFSDEQIEQLCRLAITEHIDDRRCQHCKGTGEVVRTIKGSKRPMVCPSCGGTGSYSYSGRAKAKAVGIHKNTWRDRHVDQVYHKMLGSLQSWQSWGRRRMNRYLRY